MAKNTETSPAVSSQPENIAPGAKGFFALLVPFILTGLFGWLLLSY